MASPCNTMQDAPSERGLQFLSAKEVAEKVKLSPRTIYALVDSSEFPKPVRLTGIRIAWVEHEVEGWMLQKIAERGGGNV